MENKVTADYLDEEGCLHCGICGKRKQMKVSLMGFEHVVSCLCECEVKARQELDEKMQREEAQRQLYQRKSVGLRERRFWEWKFENDNGSNQKILIARQYVENWTDMKRKNVGLLLMGPVGTGKSFFAGCIANALLEQGERVMMTNFSRILNEMTSYQANKNQIIQNIVDYPLLIIDDLGIERNSEFALEQVYNVIDSRYCKMLPLIVTTNLGLNEMKSTDLDTAHQRIYSRILEMCVPIYCGFVLSNNWKDLLAGIVVAVVLKVLVWQKQADAKKLRKGIEYGSARWGTAEDIKPYMSEDPWMNIPLTATEALTMESRPKQPKYARNKNIVVIGGSGSGKTRFFVKPSVMQMNCSMVITDPKGTLIEECGKMLAKGPPKKDKNGNIMKDKSGKVVHTFNITMAVFDVGQHVVNNAAGVISGNTAVDATEAISRIVDALEDMELGDVIKELVVGKEYTMP